MASGSKAREILNYSFLVALADDGRIDDGELAFIKSLALEDGVLDAEEKDALKRILALVDRSELSRAAQEELSRFCDFHGL